jgi:hypothetical protein
VPAGGPPVNVRIAARPHAGQVAVSDRADGGIDLRSAAWHVDRVLTPPAGSGRITELGFDHTGRHLSAATDQGRALVWDLAGTGPPAVFRSDSTVTIVDGRVLVTAGTRIDVYDVATRARVLLIPAGLPVTGARQGAGGLTVATEVGDQRFYEQGRYTGLAVLPLDGRALRDHLCRISAYPALTAQDRSFLTRGVRPPAHACP